MTKNKKYVISFSLGYCSSACLVDNEGNVIRAISEERISRIKENKKFPINAIQFCLKDINYNDIEAITFSNYEKNSFDTLTTRYFKEEDIKNILVTCEKDNYEQFIQKLFVREFRLLKPVHQTEHHKAHALTAFVASGFKPANTLVITSDGFGDSFSATLHTIDENKKLLRLFEYCQDNKSSLGLIYQYTTEAMGFRPHRDEYKCLGEESLATGNHPEYYEFFKNLFSYNKAKHQIEISVPNFIPNLEINKYIDDFDFMQALRQHIIKRFENEKDQKPDIARALQKRFEEVMLGWIEDILDYHYLKKPLNLCLAGGTFLNVKINGMIAQLNRVNELYVFPAAGDMGVCIGSAYDYFKIKSCKLETLFLGTDIKDDLEKTLKCFPDMIIHTIEKKNIAKKIAELLADKDNVVNIAQGKMCFGPRALLNRSTLADTSNPAINEKINRACGRHETMPFCPVTIEEFAPDLFIGYEKAKECSRNMIVTYVTTDEYRRDYPATMHKIPDTNDFSARPQVIKCNEGSLRWKIVKEYYKKTHRKSFLNTSFNVHNSPIVNSSYDALKTFIYMNLEKSYLMIDNILISFDENKEMFSKLAEEYKKESYI